MNEHLKVIMEGTHLKI